MERQEILQAAAQCVCRDRNDQYGSPEDSFQMIAYFWSTYLDTLIGPRDVAAMMALLKIARIKKSMKEDNWVDLAGYAACGGEIDDKEQKTAS